VPDPTSARHPARAPRAWAGAALFALAVAGLAALSLSAMRARAAAEAAEAVAPPPLPVKVAPLRIVPGYDLTDRHVGRVEPARATALAFERAGRVVAVLAEEGGAVAEGAVVARLDPEPLENRRAALAAARAAFVADSALAEATLDRRRSLSGRGFDTAQALDEARFAVDRLRARIAETDAELAQVALDLGKSDLRAPFAGTLSRRLLDEGAVAAAGAPLATVQETGRPRARVGVPAAVADRLSPGAALTLEARGGAVAGVLRAVSPEVDPATRTRDLLIDLPAEGGLAMGEIVRLALPHAVAEPGAWAPLSALQEGDRGLWAVYLATPDGQGGHVARREAVEALHVEDGRAFVRGAFADGALLVAEGVHRVTQGQRVAPIGRGG
jgi:RND family efflux transporter MFP subunit